MSSTTIETPRTLRPCLHTLTAAHSTVSTRRIDPTQYESQRYTRARRRCLSEVTSFVLSMTLSPISSSQPKTVFDFGQGLHPTITLEQYIERFVTNNRTCSEEAVVLSLALIDRLVSRTGLVVTLSNVFRLFAVSVVVAWKTQDDKFYTNRWYAALAGISIEEMNELEIEFLKGIAFEATMPGEQFLEYHNLVKTLVEWTSQNEKLVLPQPQNASPAMIVGSPIPPVSSSSSPAESSPVSIPGR